MNVWKQLDRVHYCVAVNVTHTIRFRFECAFLHMMNVFRNWLDRHAVTLIHVVHVVQFIANYLHDLNCELVTYSALSIKSRSRP